ncbi:hypothetical protein [Pseudovibrio denitrificans]|nr:hypothetical protein [Pseudovibrio denitrificans]
MSFAFLAFLIAGGTFSHAFDNHSNHVHDIAGVEDHSHAQSGPWDPSFIETDTVHCGANLLALVSEIEAKMVSLNGSALSLELRNAPSAVTLIDPPPPRTHSFS